MLISPKVCSTKVDIEPHREFITSHEKNNKMAIAEKMLSMFSSSTNE